MWIELRGGPRDGEIMELPNDLHSVRFPVADARIPDPVDARVSVTVTTQWVEYGPMEKYSPYWGVWAYGGS